MSTCEADFVAAASAAKEGLWLKTLLSDFTGNIKPVKLYVDNQGALKLIHHPHSHQRTKHIDIAYRFIQDRVERGEIFCEYIQTAKMVADCMTKAVPLAKLTENIRDMGLKIQDPGLQNTRPQDSRPFKKSIADRSQNWTKDKARSKKYSK
jgi:hypothetical protein